MSSQAPPYDQYQNNSQQSQYQQQGGLDPTQHPAYTQQAPVTLSPEERAVMAECTNESFFYRSLPLSIILMGATKAAVHREILKPNIKYGATPKMALASLIGYFIGKFSYASICADKFLNKAPRSKIAEVIRKNKGLPPLEPEENNSAGFDNSLGVPLMGGSQGQVEPSEQPLQGIQSSSYEDMRRRNREAARMNAPPPPPETIYDEMRRRNREPNQGVGPDGYRVPPPLPENHQSAPPRPYPPYSPKAPQTGAGGSKYGDEGFE